jgi:hypothetical protein
MKTIRELLQNVRLCDIDLNDYSFAFEGDLNYDGDLNYFNIEKNVRKILLNIIDEQDNFIYHSEAIKYLLENDSSLCRSLELASEFNYDLKNLNSCELANFLVRDELFQNLNDCVSEIMSLVAEELNLE